MATAGELTPMQVALLFAHMPVSFSVADEDDVVRFWAGEAFNSCSPKLIGRGVLDCHPDRAHPAIDALLADLKSGNSSQVEMTVHGKSGPERVIYTALRETDGTYRGVLETVLSIVDTGPANDTGAAAPRRTAPRFR